MCPSYKKKTHCPGSFTVKRSKRCCFFFKSKGSTKSSAEIYGLFIGFPLRPYIQRLSFFGGQAVGGVGFSRRFGGGGVEDP